MKAGGSAGSGEEVRLFTEEEIAGRLRGLEPIQALAVAFRCVLRSLPCMAAGGEGGILRRLSVEEFLITDQILKEVTRLILGSVDPALGEMAGVVAPNAKRVHYRAGLTPARSAGHTAHGAILKLHDVLLAPNDAAFVHHQSLAAILAAMLAISYLEPSEVGRDLEGMKGFLEGLEADIAAVAVGQKSILSQLAVLPFFTSKPLWPSTVPRLMAQLLAQWESMIRERLLSDLGQDRTVESTIGLVKALWAGRIPFEVLLDDGLRDRLSEITQRKNPLPQVLALAPRELATRLASLASRDTKLLPMLASPTRATLEGVAKSHGPALLEDVRPEWVDVADPLWLAWYAGALGRVMGGMQATSPIVPPAEPVEAKGKPEPRSTPVVKRAPAKVGTGSRPAGPSSGTSAGDAVKAAKPTPYTGTVKPSKPSRPMPRKK